MGKEKKAVKAETDERQYLYKDEELRLKRSNRLVIISTVVVCLIISLYLVLHMVWRESENPMLPQIANWINILVLITNIVTYKVEKLRKKFRITKHHNLQIIVTPTILVAINLTLIRFKLNSN